MTDSTEVRDEFVPCGTGLHPTREMKKLLEEVETKYCVGQWAAGDPEMLNTSFPSGYRKAGRAHTGVREPYGMVYQFTASGFSEHHDLLASVALFAGVISAFTCGRVLLVEGDVGKDPSAKVYIVHRQLDLECIIPASKFTPSRRISDADLKILQDIARPWVDRRGKLNDIRCQ